MRVTLEVLLILILFLIRIEESIKIKRNDFLNSRNRLNINLNDFIFIESFRVIEKRLIVYLSIINYVIN